MRVKITELARQPETRSLIRARIVTRNIGFEEACSSNPTIPDIQKPPALTFFQVVRRSPRSWIDFPVFSPAITGSLPGLPLEEIHQLAYYPPPLY